MWWPRKSTYDWACSTRVAAIAVPETRYSIGKWWTARKQRVCCTGVWICLPVDDIKSLLVTLCFRKFCPSRVWRRNVEVAAIEVVTRLDGAIELLEAQVD